LKKSPTVKLFSKYKKLAQKAFEAEKFDISLKFYSLALKYNFKDTDSQVGAILSDYAKEDALDAISLHDLYISSVDLGEPKEQILDNIKDLIKNENNFFEQLLTGIQELSNIPDGLEYKDFLEIAKTKANMRVALEDLMFSTRLVINSKEDMMSFIELLYQYDFKDEAFIYLENAITIYPTEHYFEEKFREFLYS